MKKRMFEDLPEMEQGMVILIDHIYVVAALYDWSIAESMEHAFAELIDAHTLGEFDWDTHNKRKKK